MEENEDVNTTDAPTHRILGATITVSDDIVYRDFASETVVLNLQTGQYHGLNPTAGEMLHALHETGSVDAAARVIAERHGVELPRVTEDLCEICEQFIKRGLITIVPANGV